MWSCNEALKFGRRPIHLTVLRLGWNPRATTPSFLDRFFKRPDADAAAVARPLPLASAAELERRTRSAGALRRQLSL